MATDLIVNIAVRAKGDGAQTIFDIDLVRDPVFIQTTLVNTSISRHFDLVRPKPKAANRLNIGSTAVLNGYNVKVTFDTAPATGNFDINVELVY